MNTNVQSVDPETLSIRHSDEYARARGWEMDRPKLAHADIERLASVTSGNRILDAGCGWGAYAPELVAKGFTDYLGVDHSPEMVYAARQLHPRHRFECMSMRALQLPNESFDGVWSCCSISTLPKEALGVVLQELRRVLVPYGSLMVVVPHNRFSNEELVIDPETGSPVLWYALYSIPELAQLIMENGFNLIKISDQFREGAASFLVKRA